MKSNVSIKDYFRPQNEKKWLHDPTNDFGIIPSWSKEFSCLIGLEEVVQFRLQRLDKTVYTAAAKPGTSGRQKRFPVTEVLPATLPKDPNTCAKCKTDVSCSWQHDMNSELLCHSCIKCSWRKDHLLSIKPTETNNKAIPDNSSILSASCRPVWNEPLSIEEAVFPLLNFSHSIPPLCDQQVLRNPSFSSSNVHPEAPFYSSSPLFSGITLSSGDTFSCIYHSSSSCGSSCSDDPSPKYLHCFSDLNSSTSLTSSLSSSPPSMWVSQKVKTPYWMECPLAEALISDDEGKNDEGEQSRTNRSQLDGDKTGKMATLSVPPPSSSSSIQQVLPKLQSAIPYSDPSLSPLLHISKQNVQPRVLIPNLKKTVSAEKNKLIRKEGLKLGKDLFNWKNVNLNVSSGDVSCTTSGSSTYSSDSGISKSTVPATWSAVSDNVPQQDSRSVLRCFNNNKKDSSLIGPARTHVFSVSERRQTDPPDKVNWDAAPNQKMDKKIEKCQNSMGLHGSYPSHSSSSYLGRSEKVSQHVLGHRRLK